VIHLEGQEYKVQYLPAESNTGMFGWTGLIARILDLSAARQANDLLLRPRVSSRLRPRNLASAPASSASHAGAAHSCAIIASRGVEVLRALRTLVAHLLLTLQVGVGLARRLPPASAIR
jgi:hypothetical protein